MFNWNFDRFNIRLSFGSVLDHLWITCRSLLDQYLIFFLIFGSILHQFHNLSKLGSNLDQFRTSSGSIPDQFNNLLRFDSDHFRVKRNLNHFRITSESLSDHFLITFGSLSDHSRITPALHQNSSQFCINLSQTFLFSILFLQRGAKQRKGRHQPGY